MREQRHQFWGYVSAVGQLLPNTIRTRPGDAESALQKGGAKYRMDISKCRLVQVEVRWDSSTEEETK